MRAVLNIHLISHPRHRETLPPATLGVWAGLRFFAYFLFAIRPSTDKVLTCFLCAKRFNGFFMHTRTLATLELELDACVHASSYNVVGLRILMCEFDQ